MKLIKGDILSITHGTIFHQVNCRGLVGGLAGALFKKYPQAFVDYFAACEKHGSNMIGRVLEGHASKTLSIVHVFGQIEPGAGTNLHAVERCLQDATDDMPLLRPMHAPFKMGCGIGGGDWPAYQQALGEYFPDLIIVQRVEDAA